MEKSKKISIAKKPDLCAIPAYICFVATGIAGKRYKWESWGDAIRHLRDFVAMDQTAFGRLVRGYTRGQIARYEIEQTEPPIDFWVKLMRGFGLNINWALTGKGKPYIEDFADTDERARFWRWDELKKQRSTFLGELSGSGQK